MNRNAQRMFEKKIADKHTQVKTGVAVIIWDSEKRILLEKRSDCSMWGFPGGKVEAGESVIQAAIRESQEETGLTIEITQLRGVYSEPQDRIITYPDNGDVRHLVDIALDAKILSGELRISHESEDLQFFKLDNLPNDIIPPAKELIQDIQNGTIGVIR